jgi:hypothetical protein
MALASLLISDYRVVRRIRSLVAGKEGLATHSRVGHRRDGARWMKSSGMIGAGSGHIPNDGAAADYLLQARSIFTTATVARVWSWRSAISGAATSPVSQWIYQDATRHSCLFPFEPRARRPNRPGSVMRVLRLLRMVPTHVGDCPGGGSPASDHGSGFGEAT